MFSSSKRFTWLALAGLAVLGAMAAPAHAQRGFRNTPNNIIPYPVNPNGFTGAYPTAQQTLFNSRVIGRSIGNIPPYALGFNPYPSPVINTSSMYPSYPIYPSGSPYATLSTSPYAASPYGGSLSTGGGYSLSTTGGYMDPYGGYGGYGGGYGSGYGLGSLGNGYQAAASLQGLSQYNDSLGKYQIQIQQARLINEQVKQQQIRTRREQEELRNYIERNKWTAPQLRALEAQNALSRARNDPPAAEVWSGQSLNELLKSVKKGGRNKLKDGPQVDLTDVKLEDVNLTDATNQSGIGMLKNTDRDGKVLLNWPAAFKGPSYAKTVERLTRSLSEAVAALKSKREPEEATLKDVQKDFKILSDKIAETGTTDELTPSQYTEAKRHLRDLERATKALSDPKATRYFDDWKAKGKTVAELMEHIMTNGLEFAPAASGDEAAYSALYQAPRSYEVGLQEKVAGNK